ncbi:unnamed protein product [Schistosoma turkestanicum]|nr:unnamed protein product [Schistosoma turkestanicum]
MPFPEYEGRRLFIAGESYGGVYVPTLSLLLLNSSKFDFKISQLSEASLKGLNHYNLYSECVGGVQMTSFNNRHSLISIPEISSMLIQTICSS